MPVDTLLLEAMDTLHIRQRHYTILAQHTRAHVTLGYAIDITPLLAPATHTPVIVDITLLIGDILIVSRCLAITAHPRHYANTHYYSIIKKSRTLIRSLFTLVSQPRSYTPALDATLRSH